MKLSAAVRAEIAPGDGGGGAWSAGGDGGSARGHLQLLAIKDLRSRGPARHEAQAGSREAGVPRVDAHRDGDRHPAAGSEAPELRDRGSAGARSRHRSGRRIRRAAAGGAGHAARHGAAHRRRTGTPAAGRAHPPHARRLPDAGAAVRRVVVEVPGSRPSPGRRRRGAPALHQTIPRRLQDEAGEEGPAARAGLRDLGHVPRLHPGPLLDRHGRIRGRRRGGALRDARAARRSAPPNARQARRSLDGPGAALQVRRGPRPDRAPGYRARDRRALQEGEDGRRGARLADALGPLRAVAVRAGQEHDPALRAERASATPSSSGARTGGSADAPQSTASASRAPSPGRR